jgi:penicillin-binding protein 1C
MCSLLHQCRFLLKICGRALAGATIILGVALVLIATLLLVLPDPDLAKAKRQSPIVFSNEGKILKAYLSEDSKWRFETTPDDVPALYLKMLLAYEDSRYYSHHGVDLLAVVRAAYLLLRHGGVASGASTLTMQTVRLLEGRSPGFWGKVRQAILAIKLEHKLDKRQILTLYLTVAPFGSNVEGVRAASLRYFGVEPKEMSVAQAALLVAIPQSPERRRPTADDSGSSREARDWVLRRMVVRGILPPAVATAAMQEPAVPDRVGYRFLAHHLSDRLHNARPNDPEIVTYIDRDLQEQIEAIGTDYVRTQSDGANIAILLVRNRDLAVRAYLGGSDYFDSLRAGMYDLVRAVRSPGSTLKPFIYGLAFDDLIVHPNTIATDEWVRFGDYSPENFDKTFRGEMRIRDALVQSINTIAVMLLDRVGPKQFVNRLRDVGIAIKLPDPTVSPGLAVALGGTGISMESLATLYSGLAKRGEVRSLRLTVDAPNAPASRLMSRDAAWAVADALADAPPARNRMAMVSRDGGRRMGYKTGTSYEFKDAWAIGFDTEHVVAVSIGRADGIGRPGVTGTSNAVPIMQRIFDLLPTPDHDVAADRPTDGILGQTRNLPDRLRHFSLYRSASPHTMKTRSFEIRFPANDSTIKLKRAGNAYEPLAISSTGGRPPFHWFINGHALPDAPRQDRIVWFPESRGQTDFVVIDADGLKASSTAWLD